MPPRLRELLDLYPCDSRAELEQSLETLENAVILLRRKMTIYPQRRTDPLFTPTMQHVEETATIDASGWVRLWLSAPLVSSRRQPSGYIGNTILLLLKNLRDSGTTLPWFDRAAVVITDCVARGRDNVFDPDNKDWKCVTNAMKGTLFEDDDGMTVTLLLRTEQREEKGCEITVLPVDDLLKFLTVPF